MRETSRIDFSDNPSDTAIHRLDRGELRRDLGARDLTFIGLVGVGSSICYALGVTCLRAGAFTPEAFALAGGLFALTALTYAELGAAIPETGGAQIFARRAFNSDLASFVAGWALLLAYVLTAAISAFSIAPYLARFPFDAPWASWLALPTRSAVFAAGVVTFLTVAQVVRMRESPALRIGLTAICLATTGAILALGFSLVDLATWGAMRPVVLPAAGEGNLLSGAVVAVVAFTGIEAISQLVGETRDPGTAVPQALRRILFGIALAYVAVVGLASWATTPAELAGQWLSDPLLGVARAVEERIPGAGGWITSGVSILAAVVLLVATNGGVVGASRLASSMMAHYQLPAPPALRGRWQIQFVPLLVFSSISIVVVLLAPRLTTLLNLYIFGALLVWSLAHASVIGLRFREPSLDRPFRIGPGIPFRQVRIPLPACLGLLGTVACWVYTLVVAQQARWLGLGWMILGAAMYVLCRRWSEMPLGRAVEIAKVTMPEFAPVSVKHVLVPTLGGASTEVVQIAARIAKANGAVLTAMYVMQVPPTLPLDTLLGDQQYLGEKALTRAEAIGREYGLPVSLKLVQSREAGPTIVDVAREEGADLIVLGAAPPGGKGAGTLGAAVDHVVREARCRVWVCTLPPSHVARRESHEREERKTAEGAH